MSVCSATILPRKLAFQGVSGAALSTTVLPAANAGMILPEIELNWKVPCRNRTDYTDRLTRNESAGPNAKDLVVR